MKKWGVGVVLFVCVVGSVATIGGFMVRWRNREREVTQELVRQLSRAGVTSPVVLRKSKLDADDLKFKMWFAVPEDPRFVDVFWCDDEFYFDVRRIGGSGGIIESDGLKAFLKSAPLDSATP